MFVSLSEDDSIRFVLVDDGTSFTGFLFNDGIISFLLLVEEWLAFVGFFFAGGFAFVLFNDRSRLSLLVDNGVTIVLSSFDVGA